VQDLTAPSYLLYLPTPGTSQDKPLDLVHGQSRKPEVLLGVFRPYAEQFGATLIAPVFDKKNSAGYQQLGLNQRRGAGIRPHVGLRRILDDVERLTGIPTERFHLYGHSGGAQFGHRYVMAFPDSVKRYAISSAGWYTLPDPTEAFPYGVKENPSLPGIAPDIERLLRVPVCVLVGENDTRRGAMLKKSEQIDGTQGRTRVERAERWVAAMNAAARGRGLDPPAHLQTLPDAGHDLAELEALGRLGSRVSQFLFE